MGQIRIPKTRRNGWTAQRQLRFLDALTHTRSVTRAAAFAGMSRESAYRLRTRDPRGLFALLWDRAFEVPRLESHNRPLSDGHLARLLGNDFRRKSGEFLRIGSASAARRAG